MSSSTAAFDSVIAKLEDSNSNTNFFRNLTPQERATLDNNPLSNNSSGSANELIRSLDTAQFQRLDYGRDTMYSLENRDECFEQCMARSIREMPHGLQHFQRELYDLSAADECHRKCYVETRMDFV